MNEYTIESERIDDGIVSLKLFTDNRPHIDGVFVARLALAVEELKADTGLRAVIVEGGSHYFSAGASKEALLAQGQDSLFPKLPEIPRLLLSLPVPTIAAMVGHAIGGGFLMGLWCDIAVLAEESLYGVNAVALGITPVLGATVVLRDALGAPLARELLLTGRMVTGREIKQEGGPLAHSIVPRREVRERACAIAREIADLPYEPVGILKRAMSAKRRAMFEQALEEEEAMASVLFKSAATSDSIAEHYPVAYS